MDFRTSPLIPLRWPATVSRRGGNCELDIQLGCGLKFDVSDTVAVNTADLSSTDIGPTGVGCALETKGLTGDKPVVTAIECDPYDPYACPMGPGFRRHAAKA